MEVRERLERKIHVDPRGCWIWSGSCFPNGYGRMKVEGRDRPAHRLSYEAFVGPIPEGLVIDHLCKVPLCINPEHLEPVTVQENSLRSSVSVAAVNAGKTHCANGHPFDSANTGLRKDNGNRYCKVCHQDRKRKARASARRAGQSRPY